MSPRGVDEGAVAPVVGPAIQNLAARRVARALPALAVVTVVGVVEVWMRGWTVPATLTALGGPVGAGALLLVAQRGVRRAFGRDLRGWWALAGAAWVMPFALGAWLLAIRGLGGLAAATDGGLAPLGLAGLHGLLGLRVLQDQARVSEVGRLAAAMARPAGDGM